MLTLCIEIYFCLLSASARGFRRATGLDIPANAIAYYHDSFIKGKPELLKDVKGGTKKGGGNASSDKDRMLRTALNSDFSLVGLPTAPGQPGESAQLMPGVGVAAGGHFPVANQNLTGMGNIFPGGVNAAFAAAAGAGGVQMGVGQIDMSGMGVGQMMTMGGMGQMGMSTGLGTGGVAFGGFPQGFTDQTATAAAAASSGGLMNPAAAAASGGSDANPNSGLFIPAEMGNNALGPNPLAQELRLRSLLASQQQQQLVSSSQQQQTSNNTADLTSRILGGAGMMNPPAPPSSPPEQQQQQLQQQFGGGNASQLPSDASLLQFLLRQQQEQQQQFGGRDF